MYQDSLRTVTLHAADTAAAASRPVAVPAAPVASRRMSVPAEADTAVADTVPLRQEPAVQSSDTPFALLEPDFTLWLHSPWGEPLFRTRADSLFGIRADSCFCAVPSGKAGDPVPYTLKGDDLVMSVLLLSFFLVVWVISRSRSFLSTQVSDFFRPPHRENLFAERTEKEFRGQLFLIFQTCLVYGILFFGYTRMRQPEVFEAVPPYLLLGTGVAGCCLYYLLKIVCYSFVNAVFFTAEQNRRWMESYLLSILIQGFLLLPVVLLMIFFGLGLRHTIALVVAVLIVAKLLLFYKCASTFFGYRYGWVHLFLYFCTLEIAPLAVLLQALVSANHYLQTIGQF